jgi:hypothetical protein
MGDVDIDCRRSFWNKAGKRGYGLDGPDGQIKLTLKFYLRGAFPAKARR